MGTVPYSNVSCAILAGYFFALAHSTLNHVRTQTPQRRIVVFCGHSLRRIKRLGLNGTCVSPEKTCADDYRECLKKLEALTQGGCGSGFCASKECKRDQNQLQYDRAGRLFRVGESGCREFKHALHSEGSGVINHATLFVEDYHTKA